MFSDRLVTEICTLEMRACRRVLYNELVRGTGGSTLVITQEDEYDFGEEAQHEENVAGLASLSLLCHREKIANFLSFG